MGVLVVDIKNAIKCTLLENEEEKQEKIIFTFLIRDALQVVIISPGERACINRGSPDIVKGEKNIIFEIES